MFSKAAIILEKRRFFRMGLADKKICGASREAAGPLAHDFASGKV
jgi:hypothetical protein